MDRINGEFNGFCHFVFHSDPFQSHNGNFCGVLQWLPLSMYLCMYCVISTTQNCSI